MLHYALQLFYTMLYCVKQCSTSSLFYVTIHLTVLRCALHFYTVLYYALTFLTFADTLHGIMYSTVYSTSLPSYLMSRSVQYSTL